MADDPLSAALEEIRGLIAARDDLVARMDRSAVGVPELNAAQDKLAARTPSLLAAVDAVLKLHQPVDRGTGARCKGCATHVTFTPWPRPTYLAITTALTGKDGSDE